MKPGRSVVSRAALAVFRPGRDTRGVPACPNWERANGSNSPYGHAQTRVVRPTRTVRTRFLKARDFQLISNFQIST